MVAVTMSILQEFSIVIPPVLKMEYEELMEGHLLNITAEEGNNYTDGELNGRTREKEPNNINII
jgi:hypothetical protein